jgi:hypothetical protein
MARDDARFSMVSLPFRDDGFCVFDQGRPGRISPTEMGFAKSQGTITRITRGQTKYLARISHTGIRNIKNSQFLTVFCDHSPVVRRELASVLPKWLGFASV